MLYFVADEGQFVPLDNAGVQQGLPKSTQQGVPAEAPSCDKPSTEYPIDIILNPEDLNKPSTSKPRGAPSMHASEPLGDTPSSIDVAFSDEDLDRASSPNPGGASPSPVNVPAVQGGAGRRNYRIISDRSKLIKKFNYTGRNVCVQFDSPPENLSLEELVEYMRETFHDLLFNNILNGTPGDTLIGIVIEHPALDKALGLHFRRFSDLRVEDLMALIESVQQSNKGFRFDSEFTLSIDSVDQPRGKGRDNIKLRNGRKMRCLVRIQQANDNHCLPRALVVAHARFNSRGIQSGPLLQHYERIRKVGSAVQRDAARDLIRDARVEIPDGGSGLAEIQQFQDYYAHNHRLAIMVWEAGRIGDGEAAFFDGCRYMTRLFMMRTGILNILFTPRERHYDVIGSMTGLVMSHNFCTVCNKGFRKLSSHRCPNKCMCCRNGPPCQITEELVDCENCSMSFYGENCLENHRRANSFNENVTVCEAIRRCENCRVVKQIDQSKPHVCGYSFCSICNESRPYNHKCYMRGLKSKNPSKIRVAYIFYDFEAKQERGLNDDRDTRVHEINFAVAQTVCTVCLDRVFGETRCSACFSGGSEIFNQGNIVGKFLDYVINVSQYPKIDKVICIAHNAKSYDGQFILNYLFETDLEPKIIMNGSKIMTMTVSRDIKFIDSLNYFQMPLSGLPKAFGLEGNIKKGYFPHLFNKSENQTYVGPLPDKEFYSPDTMTENNRTEFVRWHDDLTQQNYVFDFSKEMLEYCENDVDILRRACLVFRKIFVQIAEMCPFFEASTIAAACMHVFRSKFLKKDMIGIIPPGGYRHMAKQSLQALKWLLLEERNRNIVIQHSARFSEFRLPEGQYIDGYYEGINGDKIVFEYHGCFWHGCPRCYVDDHIREQKYHDKTLNEKYRDTLTKSNFLTTKGYIVIEMWECAFLNILNNNPDDRDYLKNHPLLRKDVLNPRDAFYGGRTENMVKHVEAQEGQRIEYTDICSLYPFINKTAKYPIKHPKIYVGEECSILVGANFNLDAVEGLIKCSVLPPRDLYHPVLPYRTQNKLMFPLCRTCCENSIQIDCPHDDINERLLHGTWVSDEVRKAVAKGYLIVKIDEIWQYETIQYDQRAGSSGLFEEYIRTFLKFKQEASGYPAHCTDDESKDAYIAEFQEREGVLLEKDKIAKNPGLRSVAKLCLNCFWGKFGQKENMGKTELVRSYQHLANIISCEKNEVTKIFPVNDDVLYVSYRSTDEFVKAQGTTNVVIAAYTTAQARLKLYSYLEKLGERAYYVDTDSVIWLNNVNDNEEYKVPIGNFLGDMTDELECYGDGSFIKTFISGGPKFYAYQIETPGRDTPIEICKVKGVTLNYIVRRDKINYRSIRSLVLGESDQFEIVSRNIRRVQPHRVVTRTESKVCKVTSNKRKFLNINFSLPHGYKRGRMQ